MAEQATSETPWFGEAHKDFVSNKGWKSPDDVITAYTGLEKLVGADRAGRTVILPKDASDAEGMKAFRAKLGVPEKPEEYELPFPEGDSGEFSKTAATWFHKHGVPKSAAVEIAKEWNGFFEKMLQDEQSRRKSESDSQLAALKGEWGQEFDQRAEFARRFLREAGWSDQKIARYEETFGTADMLKDFYGWGSKTGEDKFAPGDKGGGFGLSPQAAKERLEELRQQRIAEKITQEQFLAEAERLAPLVEKAA